MTNCSLKNNIHIFTSYQIFFVNNAEKSKMSSHSLKRLDLKKKDHENNIFQHYFEESPSIEFIIFIIPVRISNKTSNHASSSEIIARHTN